MVTEDLVIRLRADCSRCVALCCVAPALVRSSEFAIDKPAGHPCPNLQDFHCGIHDHLRSRGFAGCAAFDCLGAGQQVTQVTFQGRNWRTHPELAREMFDAFAIMRQLHELLVYLAEACARIEGIDGAAPLRSTLDRLVNTVDELTGGRPVEVLEANVPRLRDECAGPLRRASALIRRSGTESATRRPGRRDLVGANLRGAQLSRADLRGVLLVGADLRGADLRTADLLGADMRGADLSGADLTGSLFLLQSQVDAARGDAGTLLPVNRQHPAHWT